MPHKVIDNRSATCDTHGPFDQVLWSLDPLPDAAKKYDYLKPFWSRCPTCDRNLQAQVDAEDAAIKGGMTAEQRIASMRVREACIPKRFVDADIRNFVAGTQKQRAVLQKVKDYCSTFEAALADGRSLVFLGSPGSGKTHLSVAILKEAMKQGATGRYTTVMDMLSRIKATYGDDAEETEATAIAAFTGADLLVIDEVARQTDSHYEHTQLFRIINDRYNQSRPTILASNQTQNEMRGFLGEAVWDRLKEKGGMVLPCDWESYRVVNSRGRPKK